MGAVTIDPSCSIYGNKHNPSTSGKVRGCGRGLASLQEKRAVYFKQVGWSFLKPCWSNEVNRSLDAVVGITAELETFGALPIEDAIYV